MSLIILDRDGVIDIDSVDFIKHPDEWHPIPGSLEAIGRLTKAGHTIAVATNQSGVGRGLYTMADVAAVHAKMLAAVETHGGRIDAVCFCPHTPTDNCNCRKPKPGLFFQIRQILDADLSQAICVGDSARDLDAARSAGCSVVGVRTGNGATLEGQPGLALYDNLAAWVDAYLA